jgi:uncharacterized protein (DUF488 family)
VREEGTRVYTIGHSNHPVEYLVSLAVEHGIEVVLDVRSSPWSRFAPQFNREALERSLASGGIEYWFLGVELGGRPDGEEFYDEDGHVLYSKLAATPAFESGIHRLVSASRSRRIAVMCSEEDPSECHRRLLVARVLHEQGLDVAHIRGDGRLQFEEELAAIESQQTLFAEEKPWRSTRSVSRRRPRATSSAA